MLDALIGAAVAVALSWVVSAAVARAGGRQHQLPRARRRARVIPGAVEPEVHAEALIREETVAYAGKVLREDLAAHGRRVSRKEAEAEARRLIDAAFYGHGGTA